MIIKSEVKLSSILLRAKQNSSGQESNQLLMNLKVKICTEMGT
jgi:hypothetical protein